MKAALLISALSCMAFPAIAQDIKDSRSFRVIFPLAADDAPKSIFLLDGKQCREIELPRFSLSEPIVLPDGELTLSFSEKQLELGDAALKEAPSVHIGKETAEFYLVVTGPAGDDGKPVLNFRLVNAGSDRFTKGEMIWLNLSESTVTGQVGTQRLDIEPGREMVLDAPATDGPTYPVELNFTHPQAKGQRPLMENQWRHDPQSRVLAIIIQNGNQKAPRIVSFSDYPSSGAP